MVNVFKYQMNSFLLPEYLNEVYKIWMLQHLQHHFTTTKYITIFFLLKSFKAGLHVTRNAGETLLKNNTVYAHLTVFTFLLFLYFSFLPVLYVSVDYISMAFRGL